MSIYEFDEEREMEMIRQDERAEGEQAGLERGRAQTVMRASRGSDCIRDSVTAGERLWNSRPERVRAPYPKPELTRQDPEYHGTRETLWERAETTP